MKLSVPYLDRTFAVDIPDEYPLVIAEPNEFKRRAEAPVLIREALASPAGQIPFDQFLAGASRPLVIINDPTRPTPTAAILDSLLPVIRSAGLENTCTFLVATGAHRAPSEGEYRQILGAHYSSLIGRCAAHDARDEANMVDLGHTRNGTPLFLNRRLFDADRIIVTGSVEPHYFAGFTGGRKAFLPGVAGFKTIEANHRLALSPLAHSLALEGNPVHEDMMDALSLIKLPVFAVMTVLDKEQKTAEVKAGGIVESFNEAVSAAKKIFCVKIPEAADVVLSVARFPMDIDLYQSQKAIDNGAAALKDGGALILVSSCREGIGDETYARLLSAASSPDDALRRIGEGYHLGYHKAAKMAEVSRRAAVAAVSELSREQLAGMFIEKAASPQEALDRALRKLPERGVGLPNILVLPDGCVTVPCISS